MTAQAGKIIKNKTNYLDFLKSLSSYLTNQVNNPNQISNLLIKHKVGKRELFKRLISYYYHSPHIINYINQYMNNKFDFYKFDEIELIHSIKFIGQQNNIKRFYFLKSTDSKNINKPIIKKLLKEYFNTIKNAYINDLELNSLYELHKSNIEYLDSLNVLINGENSKLNLQYESIEPKTSNNQLQNINEKIQKQIETPLSNEIIKYNSSLLDYKINNETCKKCLLFDHKMVPIDTNVLRPEKVDIMFILLNPGYNEGLYNRLLVGDAGKLFRSYLVQFDENIKYVITNIIMCNTKNQAEIGKTDKKIKTVIKNCSNYLKKIMNDFPAKVYIPIGKHAMESFNISGSITQNSGKVLNQNIIPLIHPSSVLQNESNKPIFEKSFETINIIAHKITQSKKEPTLINNPKKVKTDILSKIPKTNTPSIQYNIPSENIIDDPDSSLTYLDSITLEYDNIVHVYLDKDGIKKYIFDKIKIPIYIKNSEFNDRELLTNHVDSVFYVNKNQKYNLTKTLSDNLTKHNCAAISKNY